MEEKECKCNEIFQELSDIDVPKYNSSSSSKEYGDKAKMFNKDVDNKTLAFPNFANKEKELLEYEEYTKGLRPKFYIEDLPWNL